MKYILDAESMADIDSTTINEYKIPALVLMEKAAQSVATVALGAISPEEKVLILCGCGNNGADGVATARLLFQKNIDVTIFLSGLSRHTKELDIQLEIAEKLGIKIITKLEELDYDLIIDALFGIGLSRDITGDLAILIDRVNESGKKVLAIDIPSGINSTNASVMGTAIKADMTVTFGYHKHGHILFPGRKYCGKVLLFDIGFVNPSPAKLNTFDYTLELSDLKNLPARVSDSNKGSYGKVLVIAGSKDCCGAAIMSAKAALKTGCGMVRVYTHEDNRSAIATALPESLIATYKDDIDFVALKGFVDWADSVVMGPGIGLSPTAVKLVKYAFNNINKPLIIDADAINICAANPELLGLVKNNFIFTPHLKEMSKLIDVDVNRIKQDIVDTCRLFAIDKKCVCVLKDSVTIVAKSSQKVYINTVGNNGMATAGSGDVLTGIVASLAAQGMNVGNSAIYGVFVHGLAGDFAMESLTAYSMSAMDIIDNLYKVFRSI